MVSAQPPLAPMADWPVQWWEDSVGHLWYRQGVFVTQSRVSRIDVEFATRLHDRLDGILGLHRDELIALGGIAVVHDWRSIRGYDSDARRYFLARMRQRPTGYLRVSTVCIQPTPLLTMAVQTGNLLASMLFSKRIGIATEVEPALRALGLLASPSRVSPP